MVLLVVKTSLPKGFNNHKPEMEEQRGTRTGEYMLLFGFVFVAAVITMAVVGPQIVQLLAVSAGL